MNTAAKPPTSSRHRAMPQAKALANGSRVSFMSDVAGDPTSLAIKTIEAEKPFILAWRLNNPQGMGVMASCNITGVFEPRRNATYRARFIQDIAAKQCVVQILVKDPVSGKASIEPSFRQLPVKCANNIDG